MNILTSSTIKVIIFSVVILGLITLDPMLIDIPPHSRNIIWLIFLVSGLLLLLHYSKLGVKSEPNPLPGQEKHHRVENTLKGNVVEYGSNRIGDIDKILIRVNQVDHWLHFPPHTARQVLNIAPEQTYVVAQVRKGKAKLFGNIFIHELVSIHSVSLEKSVQVDRIVPPPPVKGESITLSGTIKQFKLDEKGQVSGFIIDKYIVDLPPGMGETMASLLKNAKELSVNGYVRSPEDGFVNTSRLLLIKPYSLVIDNTDYLL
ncbi:hypothetical protein QNI16_33910 [Cytophagaceae bacterium YF14B1]|uniref:Uncharacterized protein n=1 Tax=Xanthocytophaga flava TaxID=3048013 RepID=A0AAE3UAG5_9BACT|nr:hypothetical protein [Xanthocytophaga flavus]MDJ1485536.1 hypothetical protein [Xanthocytophaga flavus]